MMRNVIRLRFNSPEPAQIRSNALAGIFTNGDEGNAITFDDETGIVYIAKPGRTRALSISACAWVEFENDTKAGDVRRDAPPRPPAR